MRKCDMRTQNRHYFWSHYTKISKKQVLDLIQQI